jgi:hypothetical protein
MEVNKRGEEGEECIFGPLSLIFAWHAGFLFVYIFSSYEPVK